MFYFCTVELKVSATFNRQARCQNKSQRHGQTMMKTIINLTKDLQREAESKLIGNDVNEEVYVVVSKEKFLILQSLVGKYRQEAASKKEDAVATFQFYTELAEALKECYPAEEDCIESKIEDMALDAVEL